MTMIIPRTVIFFKELIIISELVESNPEVGSSKKSKIGRKSTKSTLKYGRPDKT